MMQMLGMRGGGRQQKVIEPAAPPPSPSPGAAAGADEGSQGSVHARALRLVYCDDKGRFKMDVEAVAALQLVKGAVGVVAVCGRARQGKSFILNQLLGRSSGFQVAPTHRPCTKGLWMWSTPLKRIAADGSEYSLVLLDTEGIDAYDQTGTYSTQIFSLAVLLSSMFVYNQMGGIDEAALDRLSLVTEMTKHIQVRASSSSSSSRSHPAATSTAAELGQFAPHFLWLLRDFYLDLKEDGRRITPRDYLESALQPMPGAGKAITAKNDIRDSIRALFPVRECFTLVRPLNDERDLQRLDQIPMERMRPEFRAGLDALTRFIFERTRPKQVGSTIMTGPMLALLTQSFLDAINAGAVPTIATSWQTVEENECRRAHDSALHVYATNFGMPPAEEGALLEAHERALQAALEAYGNDAVGVGQVRSKYERLLQSDLKKRFDEYRHKVSMESELRSVKAVASMEERLRAACQAPDTTFDQIVHVLGGQVAEYEASVSGPKKWPKLTHFLLKSLEGPIHDFLKRAGDKAAADYAALALRYRTLEDKLNYTEKQTEAAQRDMQDWKKRYEAAMSDYKLSSEKAAALYSALQRKHSMLEERKTNIEKQLEEVQRDALEWRSKYEHGMSERRVVDERFASELGALQSRCTATEARLVAAKEQAESAKEEAVEWKRKHEAAAVDALAAIERANALRERTNKQAQQREDILRAEYGATITKKDLESRELQAKIEIGERRIADLASRLKEQESRGTSATQELESVKAERRSLKAALDVSKTSMQTMEREVESLRQAKQNAEEKLLTSLKRLEDAEHSQRVAEQESRRASEVAEKAKEDAALLEKEKLEAQRLAAERLAAVERAERHAQDLEREKVVLVQETERLAFSEREAVARVTTLERRIDEREREREREMEQLLQSTQEQRANTVGVLEGLLASERLARAEANTRAESLSLQLQNVQGKLDALQQELAQTRLNESELRSRTNFNAEPAGAAGIASASHGKRPRPEETPAPQDMEVDLEMTPSKKRAKSEHNVDSGNSLMLTTGDGDSWVKHEDEHCSNDLREVRDYRKLTISKLKQALTEAGFGAEVVSLRNAPKKEFLEAYEKYILKK